MRFSLLGPIRVEGADGGVLEIRGTLRRTLLAALLLHADTVVSQDQLTEYLWGDERPATATASLHNQLMRLRQALGDGGDRIRAVPPGYLIHVEPGELDLRVFAQRRESGAQALAEGRWAAAEQEYAAGLGLWRGEPPAELPALADHPIARRLEEDRLQATGGLIEARLNLGRHDEVIGELVSLTAAHPLREAFHGQLMLALYRAGRRAEALDTYLALRRALVDDLGVEPSVEISGLNKRIADSDEELLRVASSAAAEVVAVPPIGSQTRRQLPADTRLFTGRLPELDELLELSAAASAGTVAGAAVISALNGMAGVGKSALAIHVAHRVAEAFPDGQLFVDLRGHTVGLEPRRPLDALHQLLRSLDVPPQQIPDDLDECAALYRSRLAGTKTLIMLDDAVGAAQVQPLLPAEPGCFVLITSRAMLTGLDDAQAINLGALSETDAVALLRKVAGPERVPTDHPALHDLVELCGRIPLAVRIAGARLRHQRQLSIEDLVARLKDESSRLDHLRDEDRNLVALFDTSYADLDEAERQLFRLLGLVPGSDVDAYAAANLIGSDLRTAERLLDSLLEHNLLLQHAPGRYRFHDLLRAYARTLDMEGAAAALTRLLDYYQVTASAADRLLMNRTTPDPRPTDGFRARAAPEFPDRDGANAWLAAELANLLAAVEAEGATPGHRIFLTAALGTFLHRRGPWSVAQELHRAAADAARNIGDGRNEAEAILKLSRIQVSSGKLDTALQSVRRALSVFQDLGELRGIATATFELCNVLTHSGDFAQALEQGERALALYRELGNRIGAGNCLLNTGWIKLAMVDAAAGVEMLEEAREIFAELGEPGGVAIANGELARGAFLDGRYADAADRLIEAGAFFRQSEQLQNEATSLLDLSRAHLALGEFAEATRVQERSLELSREIGFGFGEASALHRRGLILIATDDPAAALDFQLRALELFQEFGDQFGQAYTRHEVGRCRHALGEFDAADESLGSALEGYRELGNVRAQAEALACLAAIAEDVSGPPEALAKYREALDLLEGWSSPPVLAQVREGMAHSLAAAGDLAAARENIGEAVALYRRMGAWETARAESYLAELSRLEADV